MVVFVIVVVWNSACEGICFLVIGIVIVYLIKIIDCGPCGRCGVFIFAQIDRYVAEKRKIDRHL